MTALIQNFSVSADTDATVTLQADPTLGLSLAGAIIWRAYQQAFGIPNFTTLESPAPPSPSPIPVIEKSSDDGSITVGSPATTLMLQIARADTADLLRNYYHETTLLDDHGKVHTLNCGIMTVTQTMNRNGGM